MMKKIFILTCTLTIAYHTFAGKIDTTIFSNAFEKQLFLQRLNDSLTPSIQWFVAFQYNYFCPSYIDKYNQFVKELQTETQSYPVNKKLKVIYKNVHKQFFKKYEAESFFNDIFLIGNYNCVTGSALYAMVLNDLKITYTIRETPDHVYLIADPNHSDFMIETTLAEGGLVHYDNKAMSSYIEYLHNNKIIADDEFNRESLETLFKKYFLKDKTITLKELAGLQYYNKAVFRSEKSDYTGALKNIEKAELLNHSDLVSYLKSNILLQILNEESTRKSFNGKNLAKYLLSNSVNKNARAIAIDYFNSITNEMVINHPDIAKYDGFFSDFKEFADTASISDFSQTYYFYKGYYLYTLAEYSPALTCLHNAYLINPDNIHTRELITEIVSKSFSKMYDYHKGLDSLDKTVTMFPFLLADKSKREVFISLYSYLIADGYRSNNNEIAEEYLGKFETLIKESPLKEREEDMVVQVYNQMATYYYGHSQYASALKALERGLKFVPDSWILKERHKSIANYKPNADIAQKNKQMLFGPENYNKYQKAQAYAKLHKDNIRTGVTKFLNGKWKIHSTIKDKGFKHSEKNENLTLTFFKNQIVNVNMDGVEQIQGIWRFKPETGILSISNPEHSVKINFLVLDISENKVRCMGFDTNNSFNVQELEITKSDK